MLDCRKMACPKPVIMTKKEIESKNADELVVLVDNEVAVENLKRLADSMKYETSVSNREEDGSLVYEVTFKRCESCEEVLSKLDGCNIVISISSDKMGEGNDELGKLLMKSFIYTLTEASSNISSILFFNGGVNLTTKGSESIEDLKKLEDSGVKVYSCGTCLMYFKKEDELMVGEVTNMYTIYDLMASADKLIQL